MELYPDDINLLQHFLDALQETDSTPSHWLVSGNWKEGRIKILNLLSGKTFLHPRNLEQLKRSMPLLPEKRALVSFQDGISDKHASYYQQRFHATEVEEVRTLHTFLLEKNPSVSLVHKLYPLLDIFRIKHLLNEEVIKLSNGENRKATIVKALLSSPDVLILEEPFAGLDTISIQDLKHILHNLSSQGQRIFLFTSKLNEIPEWVTHAFLIENPASVQFLSKPFFQENKPIKSEFPPVSILHLPTPPEFNPSMIFELHNATVQYGNHMVLDKINWKVQWQEKWALRGPNGAGKSTLLSLVFADHPQTYSNEIILFGRKRGTGETIWDIKEKIGFFSPEFYYYYDKSTLCRDALFSGLKENPYKPVVISPQQVQFVLELTGYFNLTAYMDSPLHRLDPANQRLILILRAMVKNPPLLILDEPYHGFDEILVSKLNRLIDLYCQNRTLILVSHNQGDYPSLIEKIFELKDGKGTESLTILT